MKQVLIFLFLSTFCFDLIGQDIFRTTCQGKTDRLDSLLATVPLDTIDKRERSLVHWAVGCNQRAVFDYLLAQGADINPMDSQKQTPMHMAIRYNDETFFDLLLKLQKNEEWKDKFGASLMEKAILTKNKKFVVKLLEAGVDVNARNERGSTALEIAERVKAQEISDLLLISGAEESLVRTFEPEGTYMGFPAPGMTPEVFAPNFISTEEYEFGSVFNAAGTEFYYGVDTGNKSEIRFTRLVDNKWTKPVVIKPEDRYGANDPFLSPDENRLYFISQRPLDGTGDPKDDYDIWYWEKTPEGWSEPINAGTNINSTGNEYYISFTNKGTMYFASNVNAPEGEEGNLDIYFSEYSKSTFQEPLVLGAAVNSEHYEADVFVDPNERYLIFCSTRPDGLGRGDLYISFKKPDGSWSKAISMGDKINTNNHELCPYVSPDGKYFFYTSNEDIFWVSTEIFEALRRKGTRTR